MEHLDNFGDSRQMARCVYCGGNTSTRDHVPSKIFLDEPFPENLPNVPACTECNSGFSRDEEYLACLIECARTRGTDPSNIQREKIKKSLTHSIGLAHLIKVSQTTSKDGLTVFRFDSGRVRNVLLKLVKGHSAFELNEPQYTEPTILNFEPIHTLSETERLNFNTPPPSTAYPEVGSRGMHRAVSNQADWVAVQDGRYRYLTAIVREKCIIRLIISEYLACEAIWD